MPTTLRIKRRSSGGGTGGPSTLAASELAINETSGFRILYYGLGNDGFGTATSVIPIGGPDFNPPTNLSGVITSNNSVTTITSQTGTGTKFVVDTSPVLITPNIGVPSAGTLTNCTGLPISTGVSGLASGAATFLATPTSANLALLLSDEVGSGANVFANTPTLITPVLGVATATSINKITFTQPLTGATLTIADGATLSVPSTGSISGTNTGDNATNSQYSSLITNQTHTGDATGATALTVVRINGQSLALLATGILKNTTTTGVPSIAVASDFPTLNQSTTGNAATVTTNANLTGPITSIGNATSVASQTGTGSTFVMNTSPSLVTPVLGTPASGNLANCTFPILNQSTTGTSANVTGVVAIVNGGTGQTTQQLAINALTGTQGAGKFLRSDGTNATLSAITAADVPVLSGVITSNSSGVTSITSQTGTGTKFVVDNSPVLVTPNIGVASGTSLTLSGNLVVNGTTVSLNATNLEIVDKNIILGNAASPTEITCDGGGITLKSSATDHTFNYVAATTSWTSSENFNLASGKTLKIAGTTVLSATAIYGVDIDGGSF